MTNLERAYLNAITDYGCCLCRALGYGPTPPTVHHPRRGTGIGRKAPHTEAIPLCYYHHQGPGGVHGLGVKRWEREYNTTEKQLWHTHCKQILDRLTTTPR